MIYTTETRFETVMSNSSITMNKCLNWAIVNQGNSYVTVNNVYVMAPGDVMMDTNSNPDIRCVANFDFTFDKTSPQAHYALTPGSSPTERNAPVYDTGRPQPPINKIVIIQTFITNG